MPDDSKEPKEYFVNRLSEQVGEMEEEISELEVRLEDSGWDPKLDYEKEIDEVKIALRDARERLSELESSGRKGWPTMYKETDASLGDLLTRIQTLREVMDRFLPE
jgi:chromosome segregation ATPase